MSWSSVIGQEKVKRLLKQIVQSGQVAHAYLFHGQEGIGKDALALEFARTLLCTTGGMDSCGACQNCRRMDSFQHPNIKLVFALPVGKNENPGDDPITVLPDTQVAEVREQLRQKAIDPYHHIALTKANFIKINSVRDMKREAAMSRPEEGKKIFIILNADMMNAEASNSLLKTLEEPLPGTILLLTTSAKDQLLPTIVSRCQLLQCESLSDLEIEDALVSRDGRERSLARIIGQLAHGSYNVARHLSSLNLTDARSEAAEFLRLVLKRNKLLLIDAIDELASSSGRADIERWLLFLQTWIRDALLMQQKISSPLLDDDRQSMENFVSKFPHANLSSAQQSIERAIAHLDKNVYLPLILTILTIELRKSMTEAVTV